MEKIKGNKWLSLISGILVFLAGVFYLAKPLQAAIGLGLFIGVLWLVKGITGLLTYRNNDDLVKGPVLAASILDIIMGLLMVSNILAATLAIPYILGFWTMFTGILEIVKSFGLKKSGLDKWWVVLLTGILNVIVSYFILSNVLATMIAVTFLLGIYFIIYGIILIVHFFTYSKENS